VKHLRYLVDENTPHAIRDQLLRRQPELEVLAVGDALAPAFGTLDPDLLLKFCNCLARRALTGNFSLVSLSGRKSAALK